MKTQIQIVIGKAPPAIAANAPVKVAAKPAPVPVKVAAKPAAVPVKKMRRLQLINPMQNLVKSIRRDTRRLSLMPLEKYFTKSKKTISLKQKRILKRKLES